jgi:DnaJ like chaperone protein
MGSPSRRRGQQADTTQPPAPQPPAPPPSAPAPQPEHWSTVLGVSPTAPMDEVRQAYRRKMSQYHPDKVATLGEELQALALAKTQAIEAAYRQVLAARGEVRE